jgi:glycosyltransferase involved in cell wall biosynthesis
VGNLEAVKNHRYLLRVLAAARQKGYVYALDVFGEGVERARLLSLADELGVGDQLRLRGFCEDVQDRLPGYQAYVHASYSESSSLAIMEAMAVGLPVVSSTAGALGELFDDPAHGRFWPLDDPEAAARILIELVESPDEVRRAGRAAQEKFRRDYDADVVVPRLLRVLEPAPQPG